jgi:hypothetical protein
MDIREFPLAWRWTDAKHTKLPDETLDQIIALGPEAAAEVHDRWKAFFDRHGELLANRFAEVKTCPTDGSSWNTAQTPKPALQGIIDNWLLNCEADRVLPVTVSWNRAWAVRAPWGTFVERWDDFCYPSSDDVCITPAAGQWLLSFHHEEQFCFGVLPSM